MTELVTQSNPREPNMEGGAPGIGPSTYSMSVVWLDERLRLSGSCGFRVWGSESGAKRPGWHARCGLGHGAQQCC